MEDSVLPHQYGLISQYMGPSPPTTPAMMSNWESKELSTAAKKEIAYLALHVLDWGQTRNIAKNPDAWHETNKILGKHPTLGDVNRYFLAAGLGHVAVTKLLEDAPVLRNIFQDATIGMEIGATARNKFKFGINASF